MGLISLITWAVIDLVMRAVITETQGPFIVETRASSPHLAVEVTRLVEIRASRSASSFYGNLLFGLRME